MCVRERERVRVYVHVRVCIYKYARVFKPYVGILFGQLCTRVCVKGHVMMSTCVHSHASL